MAPKSYLVGITGETEHQPAIERCVIGERVEIIHTADHPVDPLTLVVVSPRKEVLGYIPSNGWLGKRIHQKGLVCDAVIMGIRSPGRDMPLGVVLNVRLIEDRRHQGASRKQTEATVLLGKSRRSSVSRWLS
jgi:hypothetical protein